MIPLELIQLKQWVCADKNKKPINPRNGRLASPTDSRTWDSYETANTFRNKHPDMFPHIGFVLTRDDPYCIIDLDVPENEEQASRHKKIVQAFDSYTEISQSGKGVHIIVKASTPKGFKKDHVEVYSSERYMITTGNLLGEQEQIVDYQELINRIALQMDKGSLTKVVHIDISNVDIFEVLDLHEYILDNQYVAEEYDLLCNGDWENRLNYQSQSDADFNMAMIICEHTEDDELAKRLFCLSGMFRDEKPRPYLDYTFTRARSKTPPPAPKVDFTELTKKMTVEKAKKPLPVKSIAAEFPPGLVGEVASYIYSSAIRPVKEMALAAAIGMVAGICSRSYSISGTGLNQYIVLLAGTGTGKEGMASGIDALYAAIAKDTPSIYDFSGPASFSSGQALMKHIAEQPCFLTILAEFGLMMQTMGSAQAASHMVMYRQALLNLYTKSGPNSIVNPSVYAKKEDSSEMVKSPNLNLLGESTPEAFYAALSEELISEGLVPRFTFIEYKGNRVAKNENAFHSPPTGLVKTLSALTMTACHTANNGTCCPVISDNVAGQLLDDFDTSCDAEINSHNNNEVHKQLWNRAHLKALRIAGLLAVGVNIHKPTITRDIAEWAIAFIKSDINNILSKFEEGAIGSGDERGESDVRKVIEKYFNTDHATLESSYKVPHKLLGQPVVPYNYLRRRLRVLTSFKSDSKGASRAMADCLQDLVKSEVLIELDKRQVKEKFGLASIMYAKGSAW